MNKRIALVLTAFTAMVGLYAQTPMEKTVIDAGIRKAVGKELAANQKKYAGNKDVMVRSGIVADRSTREVRITAFSTGNTENLPLEYVLVGEKGKAYESLAVTTAKASDI